MPYYRFGGGKAGDAVDFMFVGVQDLGVDDERRLVGDSQDERLVDVQQANRYAGDAEVEDQVDCACDVQDKREDVWVRPFWNRLVNASCNNVQRSVVTSPLLIIDAVKLKAADFG